MAKVTDPEILSKLNTQASGKVTDPALLAQLNGSAPEQSEPSWYDKVAEYTKENAMQVARRQGLAVRSAITGSASLPLMIGDIKNSIINKVTGKNRPSPSDSFNHFLTNLGLPDPESPQERVMSDIMSSVSGVGSQLKLAKAAGSTLLTAAPLRQFIAGAAGTGVASGLQEIGVSPGLSQGAGLVTSLGISTVPDMIKRSASIAGLADTPEKMLRAKNAQSAIKEGYVVPPHALEHTPLREITAPAAGKVKTEMLASEKNQAITNALAKKDLGLDQNSILDSNTFDKIRKEAGKKYEAIAKIDKPIVADQEFIDNIKSLSGAGAAKEFIAGKNPKLMDLTNRLTQRKSSQSGIVSDVSPSFKPREIIEYVKELRNQSKSNLKSIGDNAPSNHELGIAQRNMATELEDLIERQLSNVGPSKEVNEWREARKKIAKAYDYEISTNTKTGNVYARAVDSLRNKGKPISGEALKIADFASQFPLANRNIDKLGDVSNASVLDFAEATALIGSGHPLAAGGLLLRPIARNAQLSDWYQNAMVGHRKPLSELMAPAVIPAGQVMQQGQQ